jgi:hypothetical protein
MNYNIMDDDINGDKYIINIHQETNSNSSSPKNLFIDFDSSQKIKIEQEVEEEKQLVTYMDNHFLDKLNSNLDNFRKSHYSTMDRHKFSSISYDIMDSPDYFTSNSPVSMSNSGSSCNSDNENAVIQNENVLKHKKFKRLTYEEVEKSLNTYYEDIDNNVSSEFDILITYLKGQKNVYIQCKNLTQHKFNCLIIPSIVLSSAVTIFGPFLYKYYWTAIMVSIINAIIASFISLSNYLKLESSVGMYLYLANQYDKLETGLEISSNKLFLMKEEDEQQSLLMNKIKYIENKITDLKESNPILIPELVKAAFPIICHINIFTFIKKIEKYKKHLIIKFKDIKNEMRYILHKWEMRKRGVNIGEKEHGTGEIEHDYKYIHEKNRMEFLNRMKEKIKNELFQYKNTYHQIDEIFTLEIKRAESYSLWWSIFFGCRPKKINYDWSNPVIDEYLKVILND